MTTQTNTAVDALLSRMDSLSGDATPEQLAYLSSAMSQIGGKATVLDVAREGQSRLAAITSEGAARIAAVQSEGSAQTQAVTEAGDTKLAEISTAAAAYDAITGASDVTLPVALAESYIVQAEARIAVTLPDATLLRPGFRVTVLYNDAPFPVDIKDAAGGTLAVLHPWKSITFDLKANATSAGRWRATLHGVPRLDAFGERTVYRNGTAGASFGGVSILNGMKALMPIRDPRRCGDAGGLAVGYHSGASQTKAGAWPFPGFRDLLNANGQITGAYVVSGGRWDKTVSGFMPFPFAAIAFGVESHRYLRWVKYDGGFDSSYYSVSTTDNHYTHSGTINLNATERILISGDFQRNQMHITYVWYDEASGTIKIAPNRMVLPWGVIWQAGPRHIAHATTNASYTLYTPDETDSLALENAGAFPAGFTLFGGANTYRQYGAYLGNGVSLAPTAAFRYDPATQTLAHIPGYGGTATRSGYASEGQDQGYATSGNVWSNMRYWSFATWLVRPGVAGVYLTADDLNDDTFKDRNIPDNDRYNGFEPGEFGYSNGDNTNILSLYSLGENVVDVESEANTLQYNDHIMQPVTPDEMLLFGGNGNNRFALTGRVEFVDKTVLEG